MAAKYPEGSKCLFLDKCTFFCTKENVEKNEKHVFIKEGYEKTPSKKATFFTDADFNKWTTEALFILPPKTDYVHNDCRMQPFLLVDTDGPYLNDADFKKVWFAWIDIDNLECKHFFELNFKFPPATASWLTASDIFQFTMSSPMT